MLDTFNDIGNFMKLDPFDYWFLDAIIYRNTAGEEFEKEKRKKLEDRATQLSQELNAMVLNNKIESIKKWEKDARAFQHKVNEFEKSLEEKIKNIDDKTKDHIKTLQQNLKDDIKKLKSQAEKITKDREIDIEDIDILVKLRENHFKICADYFKEIIKISSDIDLSEKIKGIEKEFALKEKPNIFDKIGLKIKKAQAKNKQEFITEKEIKKNGLLLMDFPDA